MQSYAHMHAFTYTCTHREKGCTGEVQLIVGKALSISRRKETATILQQCYRQMPLEHGLQLQDTCNRKSGYWDGESLNVFHSLTIVLLIRTNNSLNSVVFSPPASLFQGFAPPPPPPPTPPNAFEHLICISHKSALASVYACVCVSLCVCSHYHALFFHNCSIVYFSFVEEYDPTIGECETET